MGEYMLMTFGNVLTKPIKMHQGPKQGGPDSMNNFIYAFDKTLMDTMRMEEKRIWL